MPFSGNTFNRNNGTHTGATVWQQDAAAGTKITSSAHDTHDQDIANGLTTLSLALAFFEAAAVGDVTEYNPTTGQSINIAPSGVFRAALINPSGTLAALTIDSPPQVGTGAAMIVAFTKNITALTWGSHISATGGLSLPSSITAPQAIVLWNRQASPYNSQWARLL